MQSVIVRHNVEMGHRLSMQPDSKCFQLHGHSWWVELEIGGPVLDDGMIINFADIKKPWRQYLDSNFDHHLCLNENDPLIKVLKAQTDYQTSDWGIITIQEDPTVENMAKLWGQMAQSMFSGHGRWFKIKVQEAATNMATWSN